MCLFDPYSGWIIPGILRGLYVLKNNKIDIIIVSGPPFSPTIIGLFLSIIGRIPLIIDYRDPWNFYDWDIRAKYGNVLFKKLSELLEKIVVKRANALVFCTEFMKNQACIAFDNYPADKFFTVLNGYTPQHLLDPLLLDNEKTVLLYAGEFYGQRKISLLARPLLSLIDNGEISKDDLAIHVFGKLKNDDLAFLKKCNLADIVHEHLPVDHPTMLRYMKGSDILFLPSSSNVKYAIPFKFYDYLSVRRPIFAVAPLNSAVNSLMDEIDCGEFANIEDAVMIRKNLKKMLTEKNNYRFKGSHKYAWHYAASEYSLLILNILANSNR